MPEVPEPDGQTTIRHLLMQALDMSMRGEFLSIAVLAETVGEAQYRSMISKPENVFGFGGFMLSTAHQMMAATYPAVKEG